MFGKVFIGRLFPKRTAGNSVPRQCFGGIEPDIRQKKNTFAKIACLIVISVFTSEWILGKKKEKKIPRNGSELQLYLRCTAMIPIILKKSPTLSQKL